MNWTMEISGRGIFGTPLPDRFFALSTRAAATGYRPAARPRPLFYAPPFPRGNKKPFPRPPAARGRGAAGFPMIGKIFSNGWKIHGIFSNDWKNFSCVFQ
ncbi:MAG: hypothetical protein IKQ55_08855 [Kiritimatiellae bacterium]|nr:hypothetical protein [Kiritimatiellia bacterium]